MYIFSKLVLSYIISPESLFVQNGSVRWKDYVTFDLTFVIASRFCFVVTVFFNVINFDVLFILKI